MQDFRTQQVNVVSFCKSYVVFNLIFYISVKSILLSFSCVFEEICCCWEFVMFESYVCSARLMVCLMFYQMSNEQKPILRKHVATYVSCAQTLNMFVAKFIGVISLFQVETYLKKNIVIAMTNYFLQVLAFVIVMINFFLFDNLVPKI